MPCYHPSLAVQDLMPNENGNHPLIFKGPYTPEKASAFVDPLLIPCGKCIGCRLDYSRAWADRMMFELDHHHGKGMFVTLTYNDKHIPYGMLDNETDQPLSYSLDKRDLQLFFKRLRKKFPDRQLRYFACGEYGSLKNTHRPHYHCVIFGLSLDDFKEPDEKKFLKITPKGFPLYEVFKIDQAWSIYHDGSETEDKIPYFDPIGFASVEDVSWETCAYTARYVLKKVMKDDDDINALLNCEPEFILSSRRPGIGCYYIEDHGLTLDYESQLFVKGRRLEIPKILSKKLSLIDPEKYDIIKKKRREFADDRLMLQLCQTDLSFEELNRVKEEEHFNRSKKLPRE